MPATDDPDAAYSGFLGWATERGWQLYPAQDEALLEIVTGSNVILASPTGSGKSLVAVAAHATALAQGKRSYYTAPIKALVSEKFFALVEIFGADRVGMVTGDSSVNPDAPLICCTAEILANVALRRGSDAGIDQVVMDEFHFYADPERGWAWQVPLLLLTGTQFVLMSATLGDVTRIADDLSRRTGRPTARVVGAERPVPLHYYYVTTAVHETVEGLLHSSQAPVYIVHFSQAAAIEQAQALSSIRILDRAARDRIAEEIGGFRFSTGFGRSLSRLVRGGIGVHHAGMLPKYRRLVEQLAQRGLLRVICGTDTLGVGINVPIRSVLFTALTKFDGERMRQLSAREFHQIAGRAGRAGFDTAGTVLVQAPEHEIENAKMLAKAADDPKKRRKLIRKKTPEGFVSWGEPSFNRLVAAEPEPLGSSMQLTAAMLINLLARGGDVLANARSLLFDNHEPRTRQFQLARRALGIYRTLVAAGVVQVSEGRIRLTVDLPPHFALNQPLSPFALAAFELLDPDAPGFALDVVSVVEATLDDPRPVLSQQQFAARGEAITAMKADGVEYDQRMALLELISYPRPLAELLEQSFDTFAVAQPWIRDFELRPKSVVRDMFERALTFSEFISRYSLNRSEGLVLRYLSDGYRALRQTVPTELRNEELLDLIEWLGEMVRQVDSSLVDEWEQLVRPTSTTDQSIVPPAPPSVLQNRRAFTVLVRNELFRRVQLIALDRADQLAELNSDDADGPDQSAWVAALDRYYSEHDRVLTGAAARSPTMVQIEETAELWRVRQVLDDPAGDHDWAITATVDLAASVEAGTAVMRIHGLDRL